MDFVPAPLVAVDIFPGAVAHGGIHGAGLREGRIGRQKLQLEEAQRETDRTRCLQKIAPVDPFRLNAFAVRVRHDIFLHSRSPRGRR